MDVTHRIPEAGAAVGTSFCLDLRAEDVKEERGIK